MKTEKINCNYCNKEFEKRTCEIKRSINHYCSKSRATKRNNEIPKRKAIAFNCAHCGAIIKNKRPNISSLLVFCNSNCFKDYRYNLFLKELSLNPDFANNDHGHAGIYIRRLIKERDKVCVKCGQDSIWNGKLLTLQIDHINGDSGNNNPNNLRLLCPNCHTQTETYGMKNSKPSARYAKTRARTALIPLQNLQITK